MSESKLRRCVLAAVVLAGVFAYFNTFDGDWVWDDASSVLLHKHVQDPSKFFQLFQEDQHAFGRGAGNFYRPLVSVSFMIDSLWSYDALNKVPEGQPYPNIKPLAFHITNMLWHIAAALLFFALLTRFEAPRFVRVCVPLVYVLHPLHTEAVAYISGRADMMSAAFMYAGLWLAVCGAASAGRRAACWIGGALCFCAALLSKESSFIYPILLALVLFFLPKPEDEAPRPVDAGFRRAVPLGVAVVLMGIYAGLRMTVLKFAESAGGPSSSFGQRLIEAGQAFAFYIRVLFLPFGLHMEQTLAGTSQWSAVAGFVLLGLCVAILIMAIRGRQRRIALGMAWFLVAWFPISGIFPLNAPMAEHWMYVPMAGFWWAAAELAWLGCRQRPAWQPLAIAAACVLCLFFLSLTVQRNQDWHDNDRLFRATLAENPNTERVHFNLAVTYGDITGNLAGARRHYEALLQRYEAKKRAQARPGEDVRRVMLPEEIEAQLSLGQVLVRQGDYLAAMEHLTPVAGLMKNEAFRAHAGAAALGLGKCFMAFGEPGRADIFFRQALAVDPSAQSEVQELMMGAPLMK